MTRQLKGAAEMSGYRRFATPPLLIQDRDNLHKRPPWIYTNTGKYQYALDTQKLKNSNE
ncbi:hypothetical protein [Aeromonas caviae]|uniref:hypothetical protein n=1 Tax=Aeromonas caviae TaxID=648 RepID=UPI002446D4C2|nr:hypothetical protein [Aeromonas caviae]MDH0309658.1 hypothetical protein [Aeromonas caviae]